MVGVEDNIMNALNESAGKTDDEKMKAVAQAMGISADKLSPHDVGRLYKAVVGGLLAIMIIALTAFSWTILDGNDKTTPDLLLTVFTGSLGALVGFFVRSPGD